MRSCAFRAYGMNNSSGSFVMSGISSCALCCALIRERGPSKCALKENKIRFE